MQQAMLSSQISEGGTKQEIKVHMGLCVDSCLVGEPMSGDVDGDVQG
jgi:hypothetical protein